jgi:hypothetical protein
MKADKVKMFNSATQTFAQFLTLLRIFFVAENVLDPARQEAFLHINLHVHCLTPAQHRHVTNAAAAMLPPVDIPLPLAVVATIMLTMGSQMLRSPAFLRRGLRKLVATTGRTSQVTMIASSPRSGQFFLRKFQWQFKIRFLHTLTAYLPPSWNICLSTLPLSAHGTTSIP